jgi:hypothetical protein
MHIVERLVENDIREELARHCHATARLEAQESFDD